MDNFIELQAMRAQKDEEYLNQVFSLEVTRSALFDAKVSISPEGDMLCPIGENLEVFNQTTCTSVTCLVEEHRNYLFFDAYPVDVMTYILHYTRELQYPTDQDILHEIMGKVKKELGVEGEGFVLPGDADYGR